MGATRSITSNTDRPTHHPLPLPPPPTITITTTTATATAVAVAAAAAAAAAAEKQVLRKVVRPLGLSKAPVFFDRTYRSSQGCLDSPQVWRSRLPQRHSKLVKVTLLF